MHALLELAERRGYRVYFLGARAEVLERALERIRERHPTPELVGARDAYFSADQDLAVSRAIGASRPDIVFVAMSSSRKEYFLGKHGRELGAPFVMGVGVSLWICQGVFRRRVRPPARGPVLPARVVRRS